jgi:hypothetical protein
MESTWPKNTADWKWSVARKDVAILLAAMRPGEKLSVAEVCKRVGLTRAQFRSVLWHARKDVAKSREGGVYKLSDGFIYRLTNAEASAHGRDDNNKGRRHFLRARTRLSTVKTHELDEEATRTHRLLEAQMNVALEALSPQKRAAAQREMSNGKIDAGDLGRLFS